MREKVREWGEWYLERHIFWQLVGLVGLDGASISIVGPFGYIVVGISIPAALWLLHRWYSEE